MRTAIQERVDGVRRSLLEYVARNEPLVIVKAPPGSGKTRLITHTAALLRSREQRVAIAAQTNSQATDICSRIATEFRDLHVVRFHSGAVIPENLGDYVSWTIDKANLAAGPTIVVGTVAKWGLIDPPQPPFDWVLVDEAWQMAWADFMLLGDIAPRFVLVGDPGQIDPVVSVDVARWVTAPTPPHVATPELLLSAPDGRRGELLELPASRRLPHDSVPIVQTFYDFPFEAWAMPGDRALKSGKANGSAVDPVIDLLGTGSMAVLTLPTPEGGPPLEDDREVADAAAAVAARLVERGGKITIDGTTRDLMAGDIGITATHRVLNARIHDSLSRELRPFVTVDTPERWQGLERPIMIMVHPLSGVTLPTAFDLDTGRLCVMASRHQVGVVIVTRDHLPRTLEELAPVADQGVGLPDVTGRGHARHVGFWEALAGLGRVAAT